MRYPINDAYNKLVSESPVRLSKKLSPQAFSKNGDQLIMVCKPSFPSMGNCRYYQAHSKLNAFERKSLVEKAKSLGLSVIPALNIDLDCLKQHSKTFRIRALAGELIFTISLNGNIRVMNNNEQHRLWLKTGKDSPLLTINAFEKVFFGKWKVDVIYAPPKGAMLKLTREGNHGEEIELVGAIKKSKDNEGLEATLFPLHSDQIFHLGPFAFGGEFGFKIKISGKWSFWEDDSYKLEEQVLDFSSFYSESSGNSSTYDVDYVNIIAPYLQMGTAPASMMLNMLWHWYATLPTLDENSSPILPMPSMELLE